ncbi:MAG: cyclic lactone autoinducer peptide [Tepidibacter sp.]|jgi:cyclic lactone autoinducer peptide|nr:cyclic lactone autoinducer peptide [Tepidibacter sp.]MCT4508786.1 cyclic lactone autoinducer peptide [Tepidibacter sp.]
MKNLKKMALVSARKCLDKVAQNTCNAASSRALYQPKTPKKLQK